MKKLIFLIVSILCALPAWTQGQAGSANNPTSAQSSPITEKMQIQQMPYFAGCDYLKAGSDEKRNCSNQNLVAYISNKLQYPEGAKKISLEGAVLVSFMVDENGTVKNPSVIRDIGEGCGEEAIRVIQNMPTWEPAQHMGKAVPVKLSLRVQFSLNDEEEDFSDIYKIAWGLLRGEKVSREKLVNNVKYPLSVRDQFGNELSVSELNFIYTKNGRVKEVKSNGYVSKDQVNLIQKIRRGGDLTITAVVQKDGEFINVGRVFEILD